MEEKDLNETQDGMTDEEFAKIMDDFFNALKDLPDETLDKLSEAVESEEFNEENLNEYLKNEVFPKDEK